MVGMLPTTHDSRSGQPVEGSRVIERERLLDVDRAALDLIRVDQHADIAANVAARERLVRGIQRIGQTRVRLCPT